MTAPAFTSAVCSHHPPCSSPAKAAGAKCSPAKGEPHPQAHKKKLRARTWKVPCSRNSTKPFWHKQIKVSSTTSPFLKRPEQFRVHSTFLRDIPHSVCCTGIDAPSTQLSNIPVGELPISQEDALSCEYSLPASNTPCAHRLCLGGVPSTALKTPNPATPWKQPKKPQAPSPAPGRKSF